MRLLTRLAGLFHQGTTAAGVLRPAPGSSHGLSPLRLSLLLLLVRNPLACAEGAGVGEGGVQMQKEHKRSASGIPEEPRAPSLPW